MGFAGFWRRFFAYWIDVLPILLAVGGVFYLFFGFDETIRRYLHRGPGDLQARFDFLLQRNRIRNLALSLYLLYCGLMEASPLRGTLGKWITGIQVVGAGGRPLTAGQISLRNAVKPLSFLVFGLGCLRVAWSPQKRAWHDSAAGSYVTLRSRGDETDGDPWRAGGVIRPARDDPA
jgi:uncharacterized RDD family membrane protein YckC